MKRRQMLLAVAGGAAAPLLGAPAGFSAQGEPKKTGLGIVVDCFSIRRRAGRSGGRQQPLSDPLAFLEHCHLIGAGGIQIPLGARDDAYAARLREQAEARGMFVEAVMGLPRDQADLERFEAEARTAKRAGARAIRVVMIPGRRYERFHSADEFHRFCRQGLKSLQWAEPVAARHRLRLAVENHKDQRVAERLEVLRQLGSEYVGACVDTGNSFALLEDPMEVVAAYAPWAFSVHLKDQAVGEYQDGFLLADVPLGEGFFDVGGMVDTLRKARPEIRFSLELITRDPLRVPCLTEEYWATFGEVAGRDLARTLRTVRRSASRDLPQVSRMPPAEQVHREEENVRKCLAYARDCLGL